MRRTALFPLMIAALLGVGSLCLGQEPAKKAEADSPDALKPVVVVSFAGYDRAIAALKTIDALGDGSLAAKFDAVVEQQLGARQVPGLDPKRPWAVLVMTDGQQFPMVGFLPVSDMKKLLTALEPRIGAAKEAGKGVFELVARNQSVFVTERNGWALIAQAAEHLDSAPKDPLKMLEGLHESYDLGLRLVIKNVPAMYRQMLQAAAQMAMQQAGQRQPGESEEQQAVRAKLAEQAVRQMTNTLNELDTLLLGVKIDEKSSSAHVDYQVTAVAGTKTARQMSADSEMKSKFAGFLLPGAAFALDVASKVPDTDLAQVKGMLAKARANALKEVEQMEMPDADKKDVRQVVGDLFDVAQKTLEAGRIDGGLTVLASPQSLTLVAGSFLADTAKFESIVKRLIPHLRKESPELAEKIRLNAETYAGVTLHTVAVPTKALGEAAPDLAALVGDSLDVVVGIAPESVYLAVGRSAAGTLKQVIDKCKAGADKAAPPMQFTVSALPIAKTIAAHGRREAGREVAGKIAKVLEQMPGKDHVTATQVPVPNGQKVQIVIESGILKLFPSIPSLQPGR